MSETSWNKTVTLKQVSPKALKTDLLEEFMFPKRHWVSRPCWFWTQVSRCEKIQEVKNPWEVIRRKDLVFCEDTSAFHPRQATKEFLADVDSAFARRFVAGLNGVNYEPQVRLAM